MNNDYSIWEKEAFGKLWDVCIIGSGITGLSTGISLLERRPSLKVLILDRGHLPLGASTRNAGFSCFGSPTEILEDVSAMGEDAAIALIRQRWEGLKKLRSRLDLAFAQYETNGGYEVYHKDEYDRVSDRLAYLNALAEEAVKEKTVFREVAVPDGIRGFHKAVFNLLEGQLHPGFMMKNLNRIYIRSGGRLSTGYEVRQIHDQGDTAVLEGVLSYPIEARKVIVTTNAFAQQLLPGLDVHGARNHVMVTAPVKGGLPWKGCFHFDRGYYYFRNVGDRVLLGGARNRDMEKENTEVFGSNPVIVEALEAFLYDHLAVKSECPVDYRWSGIIGIGKEKLPLIRQVSPRVYAGVRLSGMGIALASSIGESLSRMAWQQEEG